MPDGTLEGNLYLIGGGDPALSINDIEHFVKVLKNRGIIRISGELFYNDKWFPHFTHIDPSQLPEESFNPGLSGLNLNDNKVLFSWKKGLTGYNLKIISPGTNTSTSVPNIKIDDVSDLSTSYKYSVSKLEGVETWNVSRRILGKEGVSPHLEKVNDTTLRLFYNSIEVMGLAVSLCDYEFNCEIQGVLERMSDLTIVETLEGVRRGYFVQLNPQTNQKDIFTAVFSDDGLSYSEITPLGFPVEKDEPAWGVPDAVLMPNGLIRVYWVYTEDKTSDEKLISATSKTTKGIEFVMDPGYRLDNGYVDFEVIKAEEGDWKALMSYTPHYMPEIPQSLFYATSKDGLDWDLIEERITPAEYTYFDPTAIPIDDNNYLVVLTAAPNVLGARDHILYTAELVLP